MRGKKSLCPNIGAVIGLNIRKLNSGKGEGTECMTVLFTLVMELHGKLRGWLHNVSNNSYFSNRYCFVS